MKILHLTTHLNLGGISKYILSVGEPLRSKGHELYLASSGGEMEAEFSAAGFRIKTLPIRTKSELSPKIYWALPALIRWIREEKIDLIHAHTRITQVMSQWLQWITGIPFMTTCHGFYKSRLGRRILPAWGKEVVAISEPVGTHLRDSFHVPPDRIRIVYNGVDLRAFVNQFFEHRPGDVRKEYNIPERAFVAGSTSRLVPDKGHEYLIRALKKLEFEMPDMHVIIVGDGRHRKALEALSRELKVDRRIHFTGNLRDVSRPLAAMDIFVLPATWREGFGLSIVEAMACQKPVIVTNIWALNTLIQNQVNGVLVEPRSVEELAGAIRRFFEDAGFRDRIGQAGRAAAEERFSLHRMVEELEDVYEEVLRN